MNEIRRKISISKDKADEINRILSTKPKNRSECFDENETISYTVNFGDGIEMDIKLCGVQYEEEEDNMPWTEAVLFKDGCEICCSEAGDTFFGKWELEFDGVSYITEVIIEQEIHEIWNNDVSDMYNTLKEEYPDEEDDAVWDMAHEQINMWFDDEKGNLNFETAPGALLLVGTLERWDGAHPAYKTLKTRNIGKALSEICGSFGSGDTIYIYVQDDSIYVKQLGHDNPVNPSVFELRTFTGDPDEFDDSSTKALMACTKPLGYIPAKVYGW